MSRITQESSYSRRLGIGTAVLLPFVVHISVRFHVVAGLSLPWTWLWFLMDQLGIAHDLPGHPATLVTMFGLATVSVLAAAAKRPFPAAIVTTWLVVNSIWGWVLWNSFDDGFGQGI